MIIDVILTPAELPALAERDLGRMVCVVLDVLRATSTIVTALQNGRRQPDVLLGGERKGVKIRTAEGEFDFGNSPREYTPEKVRDKTIVSTTTNGTRALRACAGARLVLAASFL